MTCEDTREGLGGSYARLCGVMGHSGFVLSDDPCIIWYIWWLCNHDMPIYWISILVLKNLFLVCVFFIFSYGVLISWSMFDASDVFVVRGNIHNLYLMISTFLWLLNTNRVMYFRLLMVTLFILPSEYLFTCR